MNRPLLIKIHLYLSAFFAPFLLLMAITGTCYLLGSKGSVEKQVVSKINSNGMDLTEQQVKEHISKIAPDYSYEYIKVRPGAFFTRPTTRTYYEVKKQPGNEYTIYKAKPSFLAAIIEVHKGHGPQLLKLLEKVLGIVLILILISGVWLALQLKRDRKITLILMGSGFVVLSFMILGL